MISCVTQIRRLPLSDGVNDAATGRNESIPTGQRAIADLLHAFMLLFLLHDVTFYLLYTFQVITFIHISPALLAKS